MGRVSIDRHKLHFGPYRTPLVVIIGAVLPCEIHGPLKVVGLSEAPIPWPIGEKDGEQSLVVYRGLANVRPGLMPRRVFH
jgi:hypothetical protein